MLALFDWFVLDFSHLRFDLNVTISWHSVIAGLVHVNQLVPLLSHLSILS